MRVDLALIKNALLIHNIKHSLSLQHTRNPPEPKILGKSSLYIKYNHSDYVLVSVTIIIQYITDYNIT